MHASSHKVVRYLREIDYSFNGRIYHLRKFIYPSTVSDFASATLIIRTVQYLEFKK